MGTLSLCIFSRKGECLIAIALYEHQKKAIEQLQNGNILVGGVGSGKSLTALAYYVKKVCGGKIKINGESGYSRFRRPKNLYIITTARKRDTLDWEKECQPFNLSTDEATNSYGVKVIIDSWNNIKKYVSIKNSFFIFDEQKAIGSGVWAKSFIKITQYNEWIMLSATPGDVWIDYIPVFVANKFYKNRTEFVQRHIVYSYRSKFPKIERYLEVGRLLRLRDSISVYMHYVKKTIAHEKSISVPFDRDLFNKVLISRWNIYEKRPIRDVSELCYLMRKVVNSDIRRLFTVEQLMEKHPKVIIFYNFNYERELIQNFAKEHHISIAEWSGHRHEEIPEKESWIYIVQYTAGAEGWNCIETDTIIFFSQNYSYKATIQAAGRIDRLNTPFTDLYYYYLRSNSVIDLAIQKAFEKKRDFNEHRFMAA